MACPVLQADPNGDWLRAPSHGALTGDEPRPCISTEANEFSDGTATYKAYGKYGNYVKNNGSTCEVAFIARAPRLIGLL